MEASDINCLKFISLDDASFRYFILGSIEMSNMIFVVFGVVILVFGKH